MIYLNGEKYKGSVKQLVESNGYDAENPKEDRKHILRILKEYGDVWCATDPYQMEISGLYVLLYAASKHDLDELEYQSNMAI